MNKRRGAVKIIIIIIIVIKITAIILSFRHRFVYPVARVKVIIESIPNLSDGVVRNVTGEPGGK